MTKQEKMEYNNKKVIAIYSCGLVGLEVLDIQYGINDYIVYRYTGDGSIHRAKINDNYNSFKSCIGTVKLNECLRV